MSIFLLNGFRISKISFPQLVGSFISPQRFLSSSIVLACSFSILSLNSFWFIEREVTNPLVLFFSRFLSFCGYGGLSNVCGNFFEFLFEPGDVDSMFKLFVVSWLSAAFVICLFFSGRSGVRRARVGRRIVKVIMVAVALRNLCWL